MRSYRGASEQMKNLLYSLDQEQQDDLAQQVRRIILRLAQPTALPLSTPWAARLPGFSKANVSSRGARNWNQELGNMCDKSLEFDWFEIASILFREGDPLTDFVYVFIEVQCERQRCSIQW